MSKKQKLIVALATILLGVLFIILKKDVIGIAMTIIGAILVIEGVIAIIKKAIFYGIIFIIIGALIITFGWIYAKIVIYIAAALLLIYGVYELLMLLKLKAKPIWLANPVIKIVAAVFLLFNQEGTLDWIFIVCGVLLCIEGAFSAIYALVDKKEEKKPEEENKEEVIDM